MTLAIQALGGLRIAVGGDPRKVPKKARGLLVYLAMQDGAPVPRDKIADLLWPHQGNGARHSLRNCLVEIRKGCASSPSSPSSIITDFTSCRVTAETDVRRFTLLAASDNRHDLQAALNLYSGEFIQDFYIASNAWEEWCAAERDGLRDIAIDVAQRLSRLASVFGDHQQAISTARRAVHLDTLNQDSHRALIRAYFAADQRGEAIRHYNYCERLMRDELGVELGAKTRAIRDRCRVSDRSAAAFIAEAPIAARLERIATEFSLALEQKRKLTPKLVSESVGVMLRAAADLRGHVRIAA